MKSTTDIDSENISDYEKLTYSRFAELTNKEKNSNRCYASNCGRFRSKVGHICCDSRYCKDCKILLCRYDFIANTHHTLLLFITIPYMLFYFGISIYMMNWSDQVTHSISLKTFTDSYYYLTIDNDYSFNFSNQTVMIAQYITALMSYVIFVWNIYRFADIIFYLFTLLYVNIMSLCTSYTKKEINEIIICYSKKLTLCA